MKVASRFFSQLLVFIFIITTCISLLLLTFLNSTQNLLSKENIINTVKQFDFKQLMGDQIEEEIYEILEQTGLPSEYVDYILENEQLKEYIGVYLAEGVEYVLYDKELPVLSAEKLTNTLSDSFDYVLHQLEQHHIHVSEYLTEQDQLLIHQKIEYYTPRIVEKIPDVESWIENKIESNSEVQAAKRKIEQLRMVIHLIQKIYQYKWILSIGIVIQIILIVILKLGHFHFIKWLCIPFMVTSLILGRLCDYVPVWIHKHYPKELEFVQIYIEEMLEKVYAVWRHNGSLCFTIFLLLIILQMIIWIVRMHYQRRKKDMAIL